MARKKQRQVTSPEPEEIISSKHKVRQGDLKEIFPLTQNQETFFNQYRKGAQAMLLHGVAGTGKTYIALYNAFQEIFEEHSPYNKVVIIRSAVPSRDIGYLPGNEKEKIEVYVQPYQEICTELFPRFLDKAYNKLKEQNLVSFMVTSYIRGLTLDNCVIIVDECQSMTFHELDSIITRVGQNSKIIFCGDYRQNDLIYKKNDRSGIKEFMQILKRMSSFCSIEFGLEDICRSQRVKEYIITKTNMENLQLAG